MAECSISIIIPAYNVEKYLESALSSIKQQDELPDEVILIDDGSTDETLNIARSFDFPVRYQIVSTENCGQGNARNLGLSLATSEYVYFFDSDDLITKNFIESIKSFIRKSNGPDIVLFSGKSFNDSEYQGSRWVEYGRGFSGYFTNHIDFLNKGHKQNGLFCSPCLYVSKKKLWSPQGLNFGSNFLEDEAIFYPLIFSCQTFKVIDDVFFMRRNREGSTMTIAPSAKHVNGAINCIEVALKLFATPGLSERERWHVSKRLEGHCVAYILMSRAAGTGFSYFIIINVIKKTLSVTLLLKASLYVLKLDKIEFIKNFIKKFRKITKGT